MIITAEPIARRHMREPLLAALHVAGLVAKGQIAEENLVWWIRVTREAYVTDNAAAPAAADALAVCRLSCKLSRDGRIVLVRSGWGRRCIVAQWATTVLALTEPVGSARCVQHMLAGKWVRLAGAERILTDHTDLLRRARILSCRAVHAALEAGLRLEVDACTIVYVTQLLARRERQLADTEAQRAQAGVLSLEFVHSALDVALGVHLDRVDVLEVFDTHAHLLRRRRRRRRRQGCEAGVAALCTKLLLLPIRMLKHHAGTGPLCAHDRDR